MELQTNDLSREAIGREIKRLRKAKGDAAGGKYTQEDLCRDMGLFFDAPLNVKTLSKFETGRQEPTLTQAVQMAFILSEKLDWRGTLAAIAGAGLRCELARKDELGRMAELADALSRYTRESLEMTNLVYELVNAATYEGMMDVCSDEDRALLDSAKGFKPKRSLDDVLDDILPRLARPEVEMRAEMRALASKPED